MALKYKVGDKVRIKSLDWYNENRNNINEVKCGVSVFVPAMTKHCGYIRTISKVFEIQKVYHILEDNNEYYWSDEMIEGLVEEETYDFLKTDISDSTKLDVALDILARTVILPEGKVPDGYILKDENGNIINATKIVLEKKKEYPNTYGKCWDILDCCSHHVGFDRCETSYDESLQNMLLALRELIICRDAYWKLYGEEIGLGKPWEPDWTNEHQVKYTIYTMGNDVIRHVGNYIHAILAFPTAEMRDAFHENFKKLINECKELL